MRIVDRLTDDIAWMEQRLGESLQEDLGEERETDIRSEAELLEPVSGINEKLIGLLTTAGTAFTEKDATDTNTLLRLLMRRGANQMPNHPRGGKNPMSSIAAEYAAERRGVQAAQPEDESAEDGHSGKSGPLSTVDMPKPKGIPVTRSPRPLVNIHKNPIVLWSPKSSCTTA